MASISQSQINGMTLEERSKLLWMITHADLEGEVEAVEENAAARMRQAASAARGRIRLRPHVERLLLNRSRLSRRLRARRSGHGWVTVTCGSKM